MANLFYEEDRNKDFLQACEAVRKEEGTRLTVSGIASKAIYKKAGSFYIHYRVYMKIISNNGNNLPKNEISRQLHTEVLKRAKEIMQQNNYTPAQAAKILSEQQAPRFYISEARAISLYYKLLGK
ncbi:hypothetical protein [Dysgonomonas termitidis]